MNKPNQANDNPVLAELPGLGPKSAQQLEHIGLYRFKDLQAIGPVAAFVQLKQLAAKNLINPPSLNFLYALAGALQGQHWQAIAANDKGRLLDELEALEKAQLEIEMDESA